MMWKRMGLTVALIGAGLGIGGCADRYGYGGVSAGYGYADGYDRGFGYGPAGQYGYGNGAPSYFGWYNDFYYPGAGVYVYDRYRRPYRWNDGQRRYWQGRRDGGRGGDRRNWNGFDRSSGGPAFSGRGPRPGQVAPAPNGIGRFGPGGGRQSYRDRGFGGRQSPTPGVNAPDTPRAVTPSVQGDAGQRSWGGGARSGWRGGGRNRR